MNATSNYLRRSLTAAALFVSVIAFGQAQAQSTPPTPPTQNPLSYTVTDLGTLGGSASTATNATGLNLHGMIVGSSNVSDGSEHAFLFVGGQMYDLNLLCDLSLSNFKVLTVAKTIDDCLEIVGEGITLNGEKHAFLMIPTPVDGGRWCYSCCQWIWKQEGGGWQWENNSHSYQWHGGAGSHSACPPNPPHCFWWPLPCPEGCGCDHWNPPEDWCYGCINGQVYIVWSVDYQARGGQCYYSPQEAIQNCRPSWTCIDGRVVKATWAECQAKGTRCYDSYGDAKIDCEPKPGWCCLDGKVVKMTDVECRKKGGQWFASEAEAIRNCKACWWCCLDGKVSQTTWADCQNKGGECYATEAEANAHQKDCVPKGWCCLNGNVFPSTPEECKTKGGQYYTSRKDAIEHCKPCWCCFQGREGRELVQTTEADCKAKRGQCFDTRDEARKHCKEKTCWVCIDGQPVQIPEADAVEKGLQCYRSADAAKKSKDCVSSGGWCCVDSPNGMDVIQTSAQDCQTKHGHYYPSEQDALAHCKLCFCCIKGSDGVNRIVRSTEADCRAKGGGSQCFQTETEAEAYCGGIQTWCCVYQGDRNGGISFPATPAQCAAKGGQLFNSEQEARKRCRVVYCCIRGSGIFVSVEEDCTKRGGQCYDTEVAAIAACGGTPPPPVCWVCIDRNVVQISTEQAQKRKLECFASKELAQAACDKGRGWCCFDTATGLSVAQKSKADCDKEVYGKWYASEQEARKACAGYSPTPTPTPDCWCCVYNTATRSVSVVHTTKADCQAKGGRCYASEQEAKACGGGQTPTPTPGGGLWCCIDGKVVQVPEAQSRARRTECYRTEEEARAHCKGKTVWCCMDGQVAQLTEEECRARGGQAYRSEKEARARCGAGGGGGRPCWVCIDGRVTQLPEAQARARGVQCFTSREEAARSCRPKESNCWVCINGRVGQMTEAQARQRGVKCYGSREEAASNCSGGEGQGPNRPPKRPGRRR
jgi:probable HAF family extracellular repeat protein